MVHVMWGNVFKSWARGLQFSVFETSAENYQITVNVLPHTIKYLLLCVWQVLMCYSINWFQNNSCNCIVFPTRNQWAYNNKLFAEIIEQRGHSLKNLSNSDRTGGWASLFIHQFIHIYTELLILEPMPPLHCTNLLSFGMFFAEKNFLACFLKLDIFKLDFIQETGFLCIFFSLACETCIGDVLLNQNYWKSHIQWETSFN